MIYSVLLNKILELDLLNIMLNDLNCICTSCFVEKLKYQNLLEKIIADGHLKPHPKARDLTGKGDCGRRLGPVA